MKKRTFKNAEERLEFIQGAVRFALEETQGEQVETGARITYALTMFWAAVNQDDVIPKQELEAALAGLQRTGYYPLGGYIFRVENMPTGPRCWVEEVSGVPEALAELYRAAIQSDETMRLVALELERLTKEPGRKAPDEQKRKHAARRIAYWLQARPEFTGLALKELELLVVAVALGHVQRLTVPASEVLQVVPPTR